MCFAVAPRCTKQAASLFLQLPCSKPVTRDHEANTAFLVPNPAQRVTCVIQMFTFDKLGDTHGGCCARFVGVEIVHKVTSRRENK